MLRTFSFALALAAFFTANSVRAAERTSADRALELSKESEAAYREGDFSRAAKLVEEAYAIHPEPTLQYNLARALEGMGDLRGAAAAYRRYLAQEPRVNDRPAIKRRATTLEAQWAERARIEDEREKAQMEAVRLSRPRVSPGAWVVTGAGGVAIGFGAFFGIRANALHRAADAAPVQLDAQSQQQAAKNNALAANVLYGAGAALAAGGVLWWVLSSIAPHRPAVTVSAGPAGVMVEYPLP
ncbi:MAG: tetratricopeptide repeat protein [Myxococcaceae bacterium]